LPRRFGDPQSRTDPDDGNGREHHAERELVAFHASSLTASGKKRRQNLLAQLVIWWLFRLNEFAEQYVNQVGQKVKERSNGGKSDNDYL